MERREAAQTAHNFHPPYRADIDGLRAVAVLAVVGYHIFPEWIHGGFVGVDVFFVISGFLISTIIFRSLTAETFSFVEFYAHRIRRIFPALIIVIAFCILVGRQVLLPSEFAYLGTHIAASASFLQNFILSGESGYFNIASELKPLNHLWSLAIEEQFYAIFPLVLWIGWRLGFNLVLLVAVIFTLSFAGNVIGASHNEIATFFSLQTRAWELMAGALVAGAALRKGPGRPVNLMTGYVRNLHSRLPRAIQAVIAAYGASLLSAAGLALICYAVFAYNSHMPYPGWPAAAPVAGASLLIASGPTALVNRFLLSGRLTVFVGLISYPLYLWHWPLLSYLTIIDNATPVLSARALAAAFSVVLAWLTYRYVERPVRMAAKSRRGFMITGLVCCMALLGVFGLNARNLYGSDGAQTAKVMQYWNFRGYPGIGGVYIDSNYNLPAFGHSDDSRLLLVGNSHAQQYENTLAESLRKRSGDAVEVLFDVTGDFPPNLPDVWVNDPTVSAVAFSYFWALNYGSEKVNRAIRCCGTGLNGMIGLVGGSASPDQMDAIDRRLEVLVTKLRNAGKQVYLVLDNPFGEEVSPRHLLKRSPFSRVTLRLTDLPTQTMIERDEPIRSRVIAIADRTGAKTIDPIEHLCNQTLCPVLWPDGTPIYKDYDHLSEVTVLDHVRYLDAFLSAAETRIGRKSAQ